MIRNPYARYKTQSRNLLGQLAPVEPEFGEVSNAPKTVHLGPTTVPESSTNFDNPEWNQVVSYESMEDVFLNQDFDSRPDFDSALTVEKAIFEEMDSPVIGAAITNDEIPDADLAPQASVAVRSLLKDQDKLFKLGFVALAAYVVFFKGK